MKLNPFSLIVHPVSSVRSAIEKPNFSKAFFIILLPSIIYLLSFLLISLDVEFFSFITYAIKNYLIWFFTAAVIYFFVFLAKGKEMKGKFASIYSAVSIIWLLISIAVIVVILMSVAFNYKFLGFVTVVKNEQLSAMETAELMRVLARNDSAELREFKELHSIQSDLESLRLAEGESLINTPSMVVVAVVAILLFFYALFVYPFLTIKAVTKMNAASSFVLYIFSMGLALFLALGLSFF